VSGGGGGGPPMNPRRPARDAPSAAVALLPRLPVAGPPCRCRRRRAGAPTPPAPVAVDAARVEGQPGRRSSTVNAGPRLSPQAMGRRAGARRCTTHHRGAQPEAADAVHQSTCRDAAAGACSTARGRPAGLAARQCGAAGAAPARPAPPAPPGAPSTAPPAAAIHFEGDARPFYPTPQPGWPRSTASTSHSRRGLAPSAPQVRRPAAPIALADRALAMRPAAHAHGAPRRQPRCAHAARRTRTAAAPRPRAPAARAGG
jgi:hypothetical protein